MTFVLAAVGVKAFYMLMAWLASAIVSAELASRKGYNEKLGLGTGLLLSVVGVVVWLIVPAKAGSRWALRGKRKAEGTPA